VTWAAARVQVNFFPATRFPLHLELVEPAILAPWMCAPVAGAPLPAGARAQLLAVSVFLPSVESRPSWRPGCARPRPAPCCLQAPSRHAIGLSLAASVFSPSVKTRELVAHIAARLQQQCHAAAVIGAG